MYLCLIVTLAKKQLEGKFMY